MPGAFPVLTGWKGPGLRKDARVLKVPRYCLFCCWPGLLGYTQLSLLLELGTRQLENRYFISSMISFILPGRIGWDFYAFSQAGSTYDSQREA